MKLFAPLLVAAVLAAFPASANDVKFASTKCIQGSDLCMKIETSRPLSDYARIIDIDLVIRENDLIKLDEKSDFPANTWVYVG
jgi:hypothetical protein